MVRKKNESKKKARAAILLPPPVPTSIKLIKKKLKNTLCSPILLYQPVYSIQTSSLF